MTKACFCSMGIIAVLRDKKSEAPFMLKYLQKTTPDPVPGIVGVTYKLYKIHSSIFEKQKVHNLRQSGMDVSAETRSEERGSYPCILPAGFSHIQVE